MQAANGYLVCGWHQSQPPLDGCSWPRPRARASRCVRRGTWPVDGRCPPQLCPAMERGEERIACNGRWGSGSEDDRAFPTRLPKPCGAASSEWGRSSDRAGCEDAEQVALFPLQPFVRRARLLHRSVVLDDPIVERLHDVRQ